MNKKLTVTLIAVLALVILMLVAIIVIGTISPNSLLGGFRSMEEATEVQSISHPIDQINNLNVLTSSMDCSIKVTDSQEFKVTLFSNQNESSRASLKSEVNGDSINTSVKTGIYFFRFYINEYIEIQIPSSYARNISFDSSSGRLESEDILKAEKAVFHSKSGDVKLREIDSKTYDIKASSGSVKIERLKGDGEIDQKSGLVKIERLDGESHTIYSSSGSIKIEDAVGNIDAKNSSGSIKIERLNGGANMRNSSGSVTINDMVGSGNFDSTSGSVRINKLKLTGDLKITNSSGSTKVYFSEVPSAKLEAESKSGSIRTNFALSGNNSYKTGTLGAGEFVIDARSSSGSITLETTNGETPDGDEDFDADFDEDI